MARTDCPRKDIVLIASALPSLPLRYVNRGDSRRCEQGFGCQGWTMFPPRLAEHGVWYESMVTQVFVMRSVLCGNFHARATAGVLCTLKQRHQEVRSYPSQPGRPVIGADYTMHGPAWTKVDNAMIDSMPVTTRTLCPSFTIRSCEIFVSMF